MGVLLRPRRRGGKRLTILPRCTAEEQISQFLQIRRCQVFTARQDGCANLRLPRIDRFAPDPLVGNVALLGNLAPVLGVGCGWPVGNTISLLELQDMYGHRNLLEVVGDRPARPAHSTHQQSTAQNNTLGHQISTCFSGLTAKFQRRMPHWLHRRIGTFGYPVLPTPVGVAAGIEQLPYVICRRLWPIE